MPGVTYTERTVTSATFTEGKPAGTLNAGVFALFGMPIPVEGATVWADPTAAYSGRTVASGAHTERTVNSTAYTERSV
jgi:hypothetical protein